MSTNPLPKKRKPKGKPRYVRCPHCDGSGRVRLWVCRKCGNRMRCLERDRPKWCPGPPGQKCHIAYWWKKIETKPFRPSAKNLLSEVIRENITKVLDKNNGNRQRAADLSERTLFRRLKEYGINP